jgi:hypothetical protein
VLEREGLAALFFRSAKSQSGPLIASRGENLGTRMRTTDDIVFILESEPNVNILHAQRTHSILEKSEINDRVAFKGYSYAAGFLLTLVSL